MTRNGSTPQPRHDIVLATVNARYSHASFGLRYLYANLGELQPRACIREFTLGQTALEIAEAILNDAPRLVGLGVYIWNVDVTTEVVRTLKAVRPDLVVVIGGPEVSHEYEGTGIFEAADFLVRGEGETVFSALACEILSHGVRGAKVRGPVQPDLVTLRLPYDVYSDEDIARRVLYVEASRGCPFSCEFCLSSLDERVRDMPLDTFLEAIERLLARGARRFKFVDRTFNLRRDRVNTILEFFLERWQEGMQVHFEIVPDRLSPELLGRLAAFPPGGLHLEAGIQTFNPETQALISRRQDLEKTEANLRFLREHTGAILHADLIAGLPGESWESFARGFDRLVAMRPQEIQVGILKRLKGTPIVRHVAAHGLVFAAQPPYEILRTRQIDFPAMQRLRRFARCFDLYYNSGNFPRALELLWRTQPSRFDAFMALSDRLWRVCGRTHGLALVELIRILHAHLVEAQADHPDVIASALEADFQRLPGRKDKLHFLHAHRASGHPTA